MSRSRRIRAALPVVAIVAAAVIVSPWRASNTTIRDGLTFADGRLESDLDTSSKPLETRIIAEFARQDGVRCRAFLNPRISGIACRRLGRWHLAVMRDGVSVDDPAAIEPIERGLSKAASAMRAQ